MALVQVKTPVRMSYGERGGYYDVNGKRVLRHGFVAVMFRLRKVLPSEVDFTVSVIPPEKRSQRFARLRILRLSTISEVFRRNAFNHDPDRTVYISVTKKGDYDFITNESYRYPTCGVDVEKAEKLGLWARSTARSGVLWLANVPSGAEAILNKFVREANVPENSNIFVWAAAL